MTIASVTKSQFESHIAQHPKVVVKFTAPWCQPCKAFQPTLERLAQENPDVLFVEVNIDQEPDLAMQYKVRSIPSTFGFTQGQMKFLTMGVVSPDALRKELSKLG